MEQKVLNFNRKAIKYLHQGDYYTSLEYLTKAKSSLKGIPLTACSKVMGITLNNFGCYYKTLNEPEKALIYLGQALEVEKQNLSDLNNLAATYLNISATESHLNNHLTALENCLKAIHILKPIYSSSPAIAQIFISAHFNASSEYFSLNRVIQGKKMLEIGLMYSKELLGNTHIMTKKLEDSLSTYQVNTASYSPVRSIRTSTAATSINKKFRSDLEKSTDTHITTLSKLSKRFGSPMGLQKRLSRISPIRLNGSKTLKLNFGKIRTKKLKKPKKNIEKKDFGIQFECEDIQNEAALKIQGAWKRFLRGKHLKVVNIDEDIKVAEVKVQAAYEKLQNLKEFKARLAGKSIFNVNEFKPIPYKSKYFCGRLSNQNYL